MTSPDPSPCTNSLHLSSPLVLLLLLWSRPAGGVSREATDMPDPHLSNATDVEGAGVEGAGESGSPEITWGEGGTAPVYFHHESPTNVTAIVGHPAALPCTLTNTHHNQVEQEVSWIRQRDLHILTVGVFTYTTDTRFKVAHAAGSERWVLEICPVNFRDAGVYECQVSSSPKISLPVTLAVQAERARVEGPSEVYIQAGSTIRLICRVDTHPHNVGPVAWYRDNHRLNYDSPRGGVSIEIEKTPTRTTSKLFLTPALKTDSGNYTCAPQHADPASALILVVSGEESAAVHTAGSAFVNTNPGLLTSCLLLLLLLLLTCPAS